MTRITIEADAFDAWLFDLDGVITDTASVHARAWKRAFDDFLEGEHGPGFRPFAIDPDYVRFVDGKPRYEGVDSFLRSRGLELDWGTPDDAAGERTVCGVGNAKNVLFNQVLDEDGVEVFASSVALIERLRARGTAIAVVTSSKNCDRVLEAAGLGHLFDTRLDGNVAVEQRLAGKPAPATFEAAARALQAPPSRAVVIEDALAGVAAGRAGGFGLVVGVARHDDQDALRAGGADIVVDDLGTLVLA
ncbi:MAG: HAD-IA family hydrolase [Pseudomonadota bacterium]